MNTKTNAPKPTSATRKSGAAQSTRSEPFHKQLHGWKKALLLCLAVLALFGVAYGLAEVNYQQKVVMVRNDIEQAGEIIKANGGVVYTAPYMRCPFFVDSLSLTGIKGMDCPNSRGTWLVPMKYGTRDLKQAILRTGGYTITGTLGGNKGSLDMSLTTDPIGDTPPPYPAPEGKEWRFFNVDVDWMVPYNRP